jgi:hypothetical protein
VTARTETAIADVEKLLDLLQTQSDALSPLDEPESLDGIVPRGAVAGCGPIRWGKQSFTLVVADRVGRQANPFGELRDRKSHAARLNLGVDSNVNPRRHGRACRGAWSLGRTDHSSWGVASGERREVGDVVAFDASQPAACLPEHVALDT